MLISDFPELKHISNTGIIQPAQDIAIWNLAESESLIIVSNDEDFFHLMAQKGFPPKVVLLKTGNLSARKTADVLLEHQQDIFKLQRSEEHGILEIYR